MDESVFLYLILRSPELAAIRDEHTALVCPDVLAKKLKILNPALHKRIISVAGAMRYVPEPSNKVQREKKLNPLCDTLRIFGISTLEGSGMSNYDLSPLLIKSFINLQLISGISSLELAVREFRRLARDQKPILNMTEITFRRATKAVFFSREIICKRDLETRHHWISKQSEDFKNQAAKILIKHEGPASRSTIKGIRYFTRTVSAACPGLRVINIELIGRPPSECPVRVWRPLLKLNHVTTLCISAPHFNYVSSCIGCLKTLIVVKMTFKQVDEQEPPDINHVLETCKDVKSIYWDDRTYAVCQTSLSPPLQLDLGKIEGLHIFTVTLSFQSFKWIWRHLVKVASLRVNEIAADRDLMNPPVAEWRSRQQSFTRQDVIELFKLNKMYHLEDFRACMKFHEISAATLFISELTKYSRNITKIGDITLSVSFDLQPTTDQETAIEIFRLSGRIKAFIKYTKELQESRPPVIVRYVIGVRGTAAKYVSTSGDIYIFREHLQTH